MKTNFLSDQEINRPISIFLVDDDKMFLSPLKHVLKEKTKSNIHIETFDTGEDCLGKLHLEPSIVVLDYHLNSNNPNAMNGIEVLRKIKSESAATTVVMLSSQDKLDVASDSIKGGAYDYVPKSESAFVRIENIVNNIVHNIKKAREKKSFEKWNYVIAASVLILILLDFVVYYFARFY
jgi:two-component system OmpR family response regulator